MFQVPKLIYIYRWRTWNITAYNNKNYIKEHNNIYDFGVFKKLLSYKQKYELD